MSVVIFTIYDRPRTLALSDFCAAIHVPCEGSTCKVTNKDHAIANFVREISDRTIASSIEGKLSGIQDTALHYLAYFITCGFNAKFEHTAVNRHDLYILM